MPLQLPGAHKIVKNILVVDDDVEFIETVTALLESAHYSVKVATRGAELFQIQEEVPCDLVILDIELGNENGFELAVKLRQQSQVPIIILSGRGREIDKVMGLELGADDYVTKPYSSPEFLARVGSVLRRSRFLVKPEKAARREMAYFGDWCLDTTRRKLFARNGEEVYLTSGEYSLLAAFVKNPDQTLSREELLKLTERKNTYDRSVDVQIMRLRRKLKTDPSSQEFIQSVRSIGYVFAASVDWGQALEPVPQSQCGS
jgi:two-component system OmpR family response regulator